MSTFVIYTTNVQFNSDITEENTVIVESDTFSNVSNTLFED